MRQQDIPPHVWDAFIEYFEIFHHDDEYDIEPETFNQCINEDDCFGKLGDGWMQQIWQEFLSQPGTRLWAMSDPYYDREETE